MLNGDKKRNELIEHKMIFLVNSFTLFFSSGGNFRGKTIAPENGKHESSAPTLLWLWWEQLKTIVDND